MEARKGEGGKVEAGNGSEWKGREWNGREGKGREGNGMEVCAWGGELLTEARGLGMVVMSSRGGEKEVSGHPCAKMTHHTHRSRRVIIA